MATSNAGAYGGDFEGRAHKTDACRTDAEVHSRGGGERGSQKRLRCPALNCAAPPRGYEG
eukprot:1160681-Pelagomonas_calceolata.AAC.2